MNLTSPSRDTLVGFARFQSDGFPWRSRVKLARISCLTAYVTTPSGLAYHIWRQGGKDTAMMGSTVTVHERTSLMNGTLVFDSRSVDQPITFRLGGSQVAAGVEEGVTGMRVGERRRLLVPPSLSIRSSYPANTPRDSTLRIEVELLEVKRP